MSCRKKKLTDIFRRYGEEPAARKIASAIAVARREEAGFARPQSWPHWWNA
jgi:16S rRNA C1402 N4-methylase RsmH